MAVTDRLSARDRQLAAFLGSDHRDLPTIQHPLLTVAALRHRAADVKPQTACALLTQESGGGRNVFGCDWGRQGGRPPWCGEAVTEARYRALRRLGKPNGVGPCQLTSFGFCDVADRRGGCWRPYPNMVTGFEVVGGLIRAHGVERGAARYNGGDSPEGERNGAAYGREFAEWRESWERALLRAGFRVA